MPYQGLLFRTNDGTKWGTGKGANLTPTEVDLNFWALIQRVLNIENNPPLPASISNFQIIGSQLKIFLSNGDVFGPYTLPVATFQFRGQWANDTQYFELDIFQYLNPQDETDPRNGLYMVRIDHATPAAPAPFDPDANDGGSNALYMLLFPGPGGGAGGPEYEAIKHDVLGGLGRL